MVGGYTLHKCYCGDEYQDNFTAVLGHNYGAANITKEPTCTDKGERATACSRCGDIKTQEIDALGHDYGSQTLAPTCTEQGYTTYTCERCGNTYIDDYIPATGHNYQNETVAPTCTKQGYTAKTCSICGDGYVNYTEMLGHIYGEPIVGNKVKNAIPNYYPITLTCERCEEEQNVRAYYNNKVSANCTNGGYSVYVYGYRNYIDGVETAFTSYINVEHVDALSTGEHTVSEGVMFRAYSISERNEEEYTENLKTLFDNGKLRWSEGSPANCSTHNFAVFKCAVCHEQVVIALSGEHAFGKAKVVATTCITNGYTNKTCADCGYRWIYDEVEATGHNFVYVNNSYVDGSAKFRCTKCGQVVEQEVDFVAAQVAQECRSRSYTTYQACITNGIGNNQIITFNVYAEDEIMYHTIDASVEGLPRYAAYSIANKGPNYEYNDLINAQFEEGKVRWNEGVPANCSTYMPAVFTCTVCYEQIVIALSGEHEGLDEENTNYVAPSCTECGYLEMKCVDCGNYILQRIYDAGHDFAPDINAWASFLATENKNGKAVVFKCDECGETITLYAKETITHSVVGCITVDIYKYDFYTDADNTVNYMYQVKTAEGDDVTLTFKYSWGYSENDGTHLVGKYNGNEIRVVSFSLSEPEANKYEYYDAFEYFFDNGTLVWNEGNPGTCENGYALAVFECAICHEKVVFQLSGEHFGLDEHQVRIVDGHIEEYCTDCGRWIKVS